MATAEMWTYRGGVRTDANLDGYEVEARDGSIGTVDEATNEVGRSYLIIDTGPWIFGRRALLPAGVIERIDHNNRRVYVNRTRDEVRRAPEYDPAAGFSTAYRQRIGTHYGTGVTIESETPRRTPAQSRQSRARSSSSRSRSSSSGTRSSSSRSRSSSSRTRSQAKSSSSRGRSTSRQSEGPTKEQLYAQAKRLNIEGRSKMNKTQLARAVGRKRGGSTSQARTSRRGQTQSGRSRRTQSGRSRSKATPVEVQRFLDGVSYPTRKGELLREAERSGARREVRTTLQRLPEERFGSPTEVSKAIGKLR